MAQPTTPASPDQPGPEQNRPTSGGPAPARPASDRPEQHGSATPTWSAAEPHPAADAAAGAGAAPVSAAPAFPASGIPASGVPASGIPASGVPASGGPGGGIPASGIPASGGPAPAAPGVTPNGPNGNHGPALTKTSTPAQDAGILERAMFEVKKVIVGQDRMIERMFVSLLARGHCLLEGVPGVAKTLAVETLARVVGGSFARIQFTPDLVPADIVGTRIYRQGSEKFDVELGPVFVNFLLADEVNRAPAKVQSALLEVMAERQVSIGGETYPVPRPFLVMATQNPIEQEGVYPLPEAQRDRFLMKILVGYPTDAEEREIVYRVGVKTPEPTTVLTTDDLMGLQAKADEVFVHNALVDYAVRLVLATRSPADHGVPDVAPLIQYGASPRASLGIVRATRALALLRGRDYALPQDVQHIAPDILRHRLVLSYDALADDIPAEHIIDRVMSAVPAPTVAPRQNSVPVGAGAPGGRPGGYPGHPAPPPGGQPGWPGRM